MYGSVLTFSILCVRLVFFKFFCLEEFVNEAIVLWKVPL